MHHGRAVLPIPHHHYISDKYMHCFICVVLVDQFADFLCLYYSLHLLLCIFDYLLFLHTLHAGI